MRNALVMAPVLIPMLTAVAALMAPASLRVQRVLGAAGSGALLAVSLWLLWRVGGEGILVVQVGGWAAPFGISFVVDLLSAIMVAITGIIALAVAVYSLAEIDPEREAAGYYPLYQILLMGVNGAFLTGDLFNLYVWFEVMLIASFILLVLGGGREQLRGGMTYVAVNIIASVLFLTAIGLTYGATGTLNLADLAVRLRALEAPGVAAALAMLFLVAFGIKAAVFPVFAWLPASYHTPPVAVSAVFAALLTKVGVYALIRVFTLLLAADVAYAHAVLLAAAGLTMITGVLGAAAQTEFRRILSFHIVSQIGYMIMGLALFTPLALMGAVFYIVHHIVVKANLFLVSGVVHRLRGTFELRDLGGLYRSRPLLAALFLVPALSLAGLPPLSGFWAKLILIRAGLDVGEYLIVAIALVVGLLTLFSMTKIWMQAFWKAAPADAPAPSGERRPLAPLLAPIAGLAALTLAMGLWSEPFIQLADRAAAELLDPAAYVQAVLEDRP